MRACTSKCTANENIPATTRHQIDGMVQALACDVTRVGTLQVGGSGGFGTPQWPEEGAPTANLLVTIAQLLGLNDTTFGETAYGTGAITV